eukprot:832920-Amphidinium_carterae.3
MTHAIPSGGPAMLHIYNDNDTIGILGKLSVKLPVPTQFDGGIPQLREWSCEVEGLHGRVCKVNRSDQHSQHTRYRNNKYPIQPTEDEADELEDYNDLTLSILKKGDEITSISRTLNDVLAHATKPGSEPHSMIRRIMRTAKGFEAWRQLNLHYAGGHRAEHFSLLRTIMSPQWNADKHFTKQ